MSTHFPPLPKRSIGGIEVTSIGLGCMNLSHAYDVAPSEADAARLLGSALDSGITFLDTAALYGNGSNERLIGAAVGHRRKDYVLASKCVLGMFDGKRGLDGRPEAVTKTLEESLKHLRTDHIDLYYLHRLDRAVPIEDTVGALARAVEAGKIGAIGVSEVSAATIRRAHAAHPIAAVQSEYSPWVRNPEVAVLDVCRALGIGFVAFSPLARGFLAGSVTKAEFAPGDIRAAMPRFQEPQFSHNLPIATAFAAIAQEAGITPAQLSLAWVLSRGDHVVAIPGTRSPAHLAENIAAGSIVLTAAQIAAVDALFVPGAILGTRYSPPVQAQIDTELLPEEEG